MSGTSPTPAEQHLGDRLAALVDGELKHDARERVLAHLATCAKCKAEAAAQRRLKSVLGVSAPPSPSEGFLARLQGLPGGPGGDDDGQGRPSGGSGRFTAGLFPVIQQPGSRSDSPGSSPLGSFGFAPLPHGSTAVLPGGPSSRSGFRIHEVGREPDRSPWRGRRFAFAAASAVSLAAIALGGALPTGAGSSAPARAAGAGNAVTPLDAASRGESNGSVSRRNGGGQGALAATEAGDNATAVAPPSVSEVTPAAPATAPALLSSATLVPGDLASGSLASGTLAPGTLASGTLTGNTFGVQVLTNVSAPPLIRPTGTSPLFARVLGRLAPQPPAPSAPPSWAQPSASALPTPADRGLPLSARR
ncbi:zf-HC2 domain-containing protein [Streptomyces sp. NBC_00846]|uniref:zf-HC2 domain-containing protein n=1 Tax=Streptomyces sp. NBC_00846 TaxID=2975849 RepID=UPI00386B8C84|nr:zf-HC2 domain-containing protein [Streptomyces sp. NBC_00846]